MGGLGERKSCCVSRSLQSALMAVLRYQLYTALLGFRLFGGIRQVHVTLQESHLVLYVSHAI